MMKNKKWSVISIIIMLVLIPVLTSSCIFSGLFGTESPSGVKVEKVAGRDSGKLTEEEFEELLENKDFLETFDTFYYPDSRVEEARAISEEQDMVYVILETDDAFDSVERYYRDKKVQSIWNRDFIYQKSMAELEEEEFIEEEDEDILISKFTFSSKDRDRVVDVLVKELSPDRTQIMVTYWDLQ
jgi:hypothetical protein